VTSISTPPASGTVIPLRVAPLPSDRGWHGIKARSQQRYTPADWKVWADLNDENARLADSERGSPAWLSDLRAGFWVLSINGQTFEVSERSPAAIGDAIEIRAFAQGLGSFSRNVVLIEQPTETQRSPRQRNRVPASWTQERPVLPGKRVYKDSRPSYLELAAAHPHVRRHVWFLTRLLKAEWHKGIQLKHKKIAKDAGCCISAVKLSQACCQHFGFLRVCSGKRAHRSNTYEVTWPVGTR
jgi:hypothetical protein